MTCGINFLIIDDVGNKRFLDGSDGKRLMDVVWLVVFLVSDGSFFVIRKFN